MYLENGLREMSDTCDFIRLTSHASHFKYYLQVNRLVKLSMCFNVRIA